MKKNLRKTLLLCYFIVLAIFVKSQTPDVDQNWTNWFSDEFNGTWSTNWKLPDTDWQPCRELWSSGTNAINTSSSKCTLNIVPTTLLPSCDPSETRYALGGLQAKVNNFPFGFYEIKCEWPDPTNRWLSFWLFGEGCEEIDIVENVRTVMLVNNVWTEFLPDSYSWYSNSHHKPIPCDTNATTISKHYPCQLSTNITTTENRFGIDWTPKNLIFYFNGVAVKEILYSNEIPFRGNMSRLWVTPGIYSDGNPNESASNGTNTIVDWVRVSTLKQSTSTISQNITLSSLSGYDYNIRQSVKLQNCTITSSTPSPDVRATNFIQLGGDGTTFEVQYGASFFGFVHDAPPPPPTPNFE